MKNVEESYYVNRMKSISKINNSKKYLEIGVQFGKTFLPLNFDFKVAVDPKFQFSVSENKKENEHYFEITSDAFFKALSENDPIVIKENIDNSIKFDLIFIDGLHTFEQSFQDFKNSLMFSHENTIWIIDDTGPFDPYSAIPDQKRANYYKNLAGIVDISWQGDVYKTVLAIHDCYPDFSYCTIQERNKQTILWRKPGGNRKPVFSSIEEIKNQTFFDLVDKVDLLGLVSFEQAMTMIAKEFAPKTDRPLKEQQKLLVGPIYNLAYRDNIQMKKNIASHNDEVEKKISEMENSFKLLEIERDRLKEKCNDLEMKLKYHQS